MTGKLLMRFVPGLTKFIPRGGSGGHLTHMGANIRTQGIFASHFQTGLGCFLIYSLISGKNSSAHNHPCPMEVWESKIDKDRTQVNGICSLLLLLLASCVGRDKI